MTQDQRFRYTYQSSATGLWKYRRQYHKGTPQEFDLKSPPIFESSAKAYLAFTEAEKKLHELGPEGLAKAMQRPVVPTFGELADEWIKNYAPVGRTRRTIDLYKQNLSLHILPRFGKMALENIDRGIIRKFLYDKLKQGLSLNTVRLIKVVLSLILSEAADCSYIPVNPARYIALKAPKDDSLADREDGLTKNPPLDREELAALLDVTLERRPDLHPLFYTLAWTGLRIGEAQALKWSDIDFKGKVIRVRRGLYKGEETAPKTRGSRRDVDMSAGLAAYLKEHNLQTKKDALASGVPRSEHPFPGDYFSIRGALHTLCKRAGLAKRSFHSFRHTYASFMLSQGADTDYIQRQLGHTTLTMTLNVYAHYIPKDRVSQADLADFHQFSPTGGATK